MSSEAEEIIEKFRDKSLKEFFPCFVLNQFKDDLSLEYTDFDQCVDEYYS